MKNNLCRFLNIFNQKLTLAILLLYLPSATVLAQEESVTLKEPIAISNKLKEGWTPRLTFSGNFSLNSNQQVIGQPDGDSVTIGARINSSLIFKQQLNEWRQQLFIEGSTNRNPSLSRYVKSSDGFKYTSTYLRSLESYPWLGPYARASVETNLFKGEDVRPEPHTYVKDSQTLGTFEVFQLTDSFKPLTTKEAVGIFAKVIDKKNMRVEVRAGLGFLQIAADGQLQVRSVDKDTTTVMIDEIESFQQTGLEYGFEWSGQWNAQSSYALETDFLTPFSDSSSSTQDCIDCSDIELTNIEIKAAISSKITSLVNISYEYKATKKPRLLNAFQIQHGVFLNISHNLL